MFGETRMNEDKLQKIDELCSYIDSLYYKEKLISSQEAEDLIQIISWIKNRGFEETNIQYTIKELRNCKDVINDKVVSSIVNKFRKACG